MFFGSDNTGPVHPQIMAAMARVNEKNSVPYGGDPFTTEVVQSLRDLFEAPDAAVHLVATGTAANSLCLSTLCNPYDAIFCSDAAHIRQDECNAPEFFTGGAKLATIATPDGKLTPKTLRQRIDGEETRGVHGPQRGPVSLTNVTECGTVYTPAEIQALAGVAKDYNLPVHLDGARFANALVATGASPAEMSWRAGIDALSFGATKNGAMGVEAVIFFDPKHSWEFELRRKRGAHLLSKHRYLAAQMLGYLEGGLWLDLAKRANATNARLATGLAALPHAELVWRAEANMSFAKFPRWAHEKLHRAGAQYYVWEGALAGDDPEEMLTARMVCDWSGTEDMVEDFLALIR
ncbi:MAG: low specificity L-threonine aldolase [Rhodobacterales bacterium]|nr:MAG: low specificity L-threonine aldolase [Rhodobacterales bacterium]